MTPHGLSAVVALFLCALVARRAAPHDLFNDTLHTIHIQTPADLWKLMEPGAGAQRLRAATNPAATQSVALRTGHAGESFAYVKADVDFDGHRLAGVGVRFKGNLSHSVSSGTPRRPMKLDFERFAKANRFAGLETINLNNQALDTTQAREALAFELFRDAAVPAPRTAYALVTLKVPGLFDNEFLGLYTLIEEIDRPFLKRHFKNPDGLLLKPHGMRGLACFGDDWRPYESRLNPKSDVDPALARRVIELAKLTHKSDDAAFARQIAAYLDVDAFLGYVAVNAALCNFDSFLSTGHNYYIYVNPADGRATFIPWDMNMSFGGYTWVGTREKIADLSLTRPYVDHNRLIERVLAIPQYHEAYRAKFRRLIDGPFAPKTMRRRIARARTFVARAGEAAKHAGKDNSPTTRPSPYERLRPPPLDWFVEHRVASIRGQLDGTRPGYVPAFRDPDLVPEGWSRIVVPAAQLLQALDADRDGRMSETEATSTFKRLLQAARAQQGASIDLPAVTTALESILPDPLRKSAAARRWAAWLIRVADADPNASGNKDARVDAAEITAAYRRLLAGADYDHDGMIGGRELIEAMTGVGPP